MAVFWSAVVMTSALVQSVTDSATKKADESPFVLCYAAIHPVYQRQESLVLRGEVAPIEEFFKEKHPPFVRTGLLWYAIKHDKPNLVDIALAHLKNEEQIEDSKFGFVLSLLIVGSDLSFRKVVSSNLMVSPDYVDKDGMSFVHFAIHNPTRLAVTLEKYPYVDKQDARGRTALHYAGIWKAESVRLLLQHGASRQVVDKDGLTPRDLAVKRAPESERAKILAYFDSP